jgi:hypothetical protein
MLESEHDFIERKDYMKDDDFHEDDEERMGIGKGVKEIFENEISEPEIMLFCKGDSQSTELLQKYSNLAKEQQYDALILAVKNLQIDEGSDKELKSHFVKNFYLVNRRL